MRGAFRIAVVLCREPVRRALLATLVVVVAFQGAGSARADGTEPYRDPAYSSSLQELLKTVWPDRYSADEQAIGHSAIDQQIRDGLFRTRGAARTYARLVLASPLVRNGYMVPGEGERWGMGWKVLDARGGTVAYWSHLSDVPVPSDQWHNLDWGSPQLSGHLTDYRWTVMCRLGGTCPDVGTGYLGLPASSGNLGWWVVQYNYDGTWVTRLWPCTSVGWNANNHECTQRDVDGWTNWGTPNAAGSPAQLIQATNDDGTPMDCDTTSAVERCYFRAEDVPTMATKIQQDRFELYGSQPYSNYFNFSWQPHVYDETAARNELDRPENSAARQWINHELNNTYPDPRRPQLVAPPSLVGSFFELETVSVTFGSWNPDQTQRTEQWQRCDSYGGLCSDIVGATGPLYSITSADVGHTLRIHELVSNAYGTADAYSAISPIVGSLLKRYTPELHYDSQESYRADSVAEITDNYIAGYQPTYENTLRDRDLGLLAGAGPNTNPHLSLDYLGTDATWSDDHFIDEQDNYAADAARLHSDPVYKNEAFGRQWTSPNGTKILQYWFFYYYNPKSWFQTGAGVHEGDWEMIQIQIDPAGNPTETVYSQHDAAEVCDWGRSSHTSDGRPIVYVAEGSHANYYDPGSHDVAPGFVDTNDGFGGSVTPDLIDISSEPPWVGWRGTYGASDRSPHGPAQHSQWTDPIGWAAQQRGCSLLNLRFAKDSHSDAPRSKLPSPPAPQLRARIVGRSVVIEYDFRSFPVDRARRPWQLLTSVIGINGFPATTRTPLVSRQGRVQVALEHRTTRRQGLLISVLSRLGTRSRVIRLDVR